MLWCIKTQVQNACLTDNSSQNTHTPRTEMLCLLFYPNDAITQEERSCCLENVPP